DGVPLSEDGVSCLLPDGGTILIPEDRRGDAATPEVDAGPGGECEDGETRPCEGGTDEGECDRGTQTCSSGRWGACEGRVEPTAEVCNGRDDDCDGDIDGPAASAACAEDPTVEAATCDSGVCTLGSCVAGRDDCNDSLEDGCETDLTSDASSCGSCGNACLVGNVCEESGCLPTSAIEWILPFEGAPPETAFHTASNGRVFVSGAAEGSFTIGGETEPVRGSSDAFLLAASEAGEVAWLLRFGAAGDEYGFNRVAATSTRVFVGGQFSPAGRASFGGPELVSNRTGGEDMVLAAYDAETGAHVWSRRYNSNYFRAEHVAIAGDTLCVVGRREGGVFVGGFSTDDGERRWVRSLGSDLAVTSVIGRNVGTALCTVSGAFRGSVDFGDGPVDAESGTAFEATYDASGLRSLLTATSPGRSNVLHSGGPGTPASILASDLRISWEDGDYDFAGRDDGLVVWRQGILEPSWGFAIPFAGSIQAATIGTTADRTSIAIFGTGSFDIGGGSLAVDGLRTLLVDFERGELASVVVWGGDAAVTRSRITVDADGSQYHLVANFGTAQLGRQSISSAGSELLLVRRLL
ncbi:MAG TPA: PQQ-binding-like beta-propeller repeat protein, partial [Polyangiaceae bacterium LLY-WYZ-15_(1-7)]|nr:PQQ-binding-like beta-propeller repeat protein [Polyangiaceae bacterium LLY-WYZ-15_(1-7)]